MKLIAPQLTPKRLICISIVMFVAGGTLVGYASQNPSSPGSSAVGYVPAVPGVMQAVTSFSATAGSTLGPTGSSSASYGGRMIELNGELTVQVSDVKGAVDRAAALAAALNGYVASSNFDDSGTGASLVLSVPEENFTSAMHALSALGKVRAQSVSSNDVTEQYVNLQAQLDSYKTEETTLLRILNQSTTVNDALNTENAIQDTQAQINDLEGQLRVMQRLVTFSTINLELTQPAQNPTLDFGDAFNTALMAFYTVTKGMLILGASIFPIAMVGGVVYLPYRHLTRRKPKPIEA